MTKIHIYSKYFKGNFNLFFLPRCAKPFLVLSWPLLCWYKLSQISTTASIYRQENYIPESFSMAANELCCFLRRERFSVRGQSSRDIPTWPRNWAGPERSPPWLPQAFDKSPVPMAPRSGPPSGTTCLKKAWAGCGLPWTASPLTNEASPLCFSPRLPDTVYQLCWFSREKPGGPRGSMTTNETLFPSWQAKQAAKS